MQLSKEYFEANNPLTEEGRFSDLAKQVCASIRAAAASNGSCPVRLLLLLAQDHCPEVRMAVADNEKAPEIALQLLVGDPHPDVRFRLAENHQLPLPVLTQLMNDENPYVADRAYRTVQRITPANLIQVGEAFWRSGCTIVEHEPTGKAEAIAE